ncbi:hypothetical protein L9F63_008780 [Diploptera punctata]|uniref:Uncharacterized protein n=1 Tax=Diploptera punctata TaxID=6984 RepID=A0AAD7Z4X6_DIPPU|nr:hypothetical protein L9F63_008780 [Diploptera punctata]
MHLQGIVRFSFLLISLTLVANAQYQQQSHNYDHQPQRPLPAILMHKQSLGQDGSFNYAFAADNGLQQGESISPDGTRRGAYSYVDPNGKKITVRYTAGKDGFKVEGDHLPKAPAPIPVPAAPAAAPAVVPQGGFVPRASPYYPTSPYQGVGANAIYRGQSPASPYYKVQDDGVPAYRSSAPATFPGAEQRYTKSVAPQQSSGYSASEDLDDKGIQEPHTFGGGYSFEFAG